MVFFFCFTSGCKKVYKKVGFHELDYTEKGRKKYFRYKCLSKYLEQTHQMDFQVR